MEPIIEYLCIDGYLQSKNNIDTTLDKLYYVTFKGRKFISDGGYQGEKRKLNDEKIRLMSLERNHKSIETSMFYLTVILAAVGIIDAIVHLLEIRDRDKIIYSFVFTGVQAAMSTSFLYVLWNFNRKVTD